MIGQKLEHYTIAARLGAGGMGVVYRAVDDRLDREVALKVVAAESVADPAHKQRFIREARTASALNHPNIVTIHDIGEADGVDFLVMELVAGQPLQALVARGPLPIDTTLEYALRVAEALEAAHAGGIVHRDIKPANIMVTATGHVKVLDFGIAKYFDRIADQGASTVAATIATEAGAMIGTLAYMSPEQARGQAIDARSDVFSFGAVLYEMLAGTRAFQGDSPLDTLAAILNREPTPVETLRADVPVGLARLVRECLAKDRHGRPAAGEIVRQLTALRRPAAAPADFGALLRRRAVTVPAALVLVAIAAAGAWWWTSTARVRRARALVPAIQALIDRDDVDGAYRLAREAIVVIPDDPLLKQLWVNVTFLTSLDSTPTGADVAVKGYRAAAANWISIGRTPLENARVPFGQVLVRLTKDGFAPFEGTLGGLKFTYTLDPPGSVPPGMVRVLANVSEAEGNQVALDDYWIDQFEVTNRQFKTFVDRGGYRSAEYWKVPIAGNAGPLSWQQAMTRFTDTTGRPGPATWELGTYAEGEDDFPVTGVSWYEAAAYAVFVGKDLPTVFHWRGAAGFKGFAGNFADILLVSNFGGKGPARVGQYKGIGPYGTYDMAGNVKEWCWNEAPGGRMILGGAWSEPSYMFTDRDAQSPLDRQPTYGFRLAKYLEPPAPASIATVQPQTRDYSTEQPVTDAVFDSWRSLFRYDPGELHATTEAVEDAPAWRKETVSFDAAYGNERVRAYLFLPKSAAPPYQTIVYFPGGDAQVLRSSRDLRLNMVEFVVRSGRALMFPVYKGTYERVAQVGGVNAYRDLTIARAKDVERSIDYLEKRQDIDRARIGYYGISLGAFNGIIVTAIDTRFKASVLSGGGLPTDRPAAETDPVNFAPRIHVPTLMINGRADFSYRIDTQQEPLFRLLGVDPAFKKHTILEGGHIPPRVQEVMKEVLDWYDRILGPVTPNR